MKDGTAGEPLSPVRRSPAPRDAFAEARALAALDVAAHLADPARKQAFVTPMFDVIAPRYDDFTRLFSFGMDARWKREAIAAGLESLRRAAADARRALILDAACGTGDLAIGVVRGAQAAGITAHALGVDAAGEMVRAAQARLRGPDADVAALVHVAHGDMTAVALHDGSVDLVTAGYAVRNAPEPAQAIAEFSRVLRPGGVLITLDFYRPTFAPWRELFLGYLRVAGDVVGWTWHRSPVVYGYIARSIRHFVTARDFSTLLESHSFRVRTVRRWLGGGVAMHIAERR
jgi:demethylmenaquinone methyltransferase/2-methoxy-6-polyprenyl-1,4-benzoquinol methylase